MKLVIGYNSNDSYCDNHLVPLEYDSLEKLYCDFEAFLQAKVITIKEVIQKYAEHCKKKPAQTYIKNKYNLGYTEEYKEWSKTRQYPHITDSFKIGSCDFYYTDFITIDVYNSDQPENWIVQVKYPEFLSLDEWFEQNRVN